MRPGTADWPTPCWRRICHAAGLTREATLNAFQASQRAGNASAGDILEIANVLVEVGEHHLAHSVLGLIDPEHPANAGLLLELGRLYSKLEDQPQRAALHRAGAREGLRRCLRRAHAGHRAELHRPDRRGGRRPARKASPRRRTTATHTGPAPSSAARTARSERVARMRAALRNPDLDNDDVTYLHYGLFKELDTLGDRPRRRGSP